MNYIYILYVLFDKDCDSLAKTPAEQMLLKVTPLWFTMTQILHCNMTSLIMSRRRSLPVAEDYFLFRGGGYYLEHERFGAFQVFILSTDYLCNMVHPWSVSILLVR